MSIKEELIKLKESFENDLFELLQNDEDMLNNLHKVKKCQANMQKTQNIHKQHKTLETFNKK